MSDQSLQTFEEGPHPGRPPIGGPEVDALSLVGTRWPVQRFRSFAPSVALATTGEEIHAIARLRYDLYIGRDKKAYVSVDHLRRSFLDEIDDVSLNFRCGPPHELLAAVRMTWARDALGDRQTALVVKASGARRLDTSTVLSRLVARPTLAARRSIVPLFQEIYRYSLGIGIGHGLLATRPDLCGIFEKFGFRMIGQPFVDPVAGTLRVLRLDLNDRVHLRRVGSPLLCTIESDADEIAGI
jgi:hypothetical protein